MWEYGAIRDEPKPQLALALADEATKAADLPQRVAELAQHRERSLPAALRKERGVVHTPPALARFMVRGAIARLEQAGRDPLEKGSTFFDPACGPGVFFASLIAEAETRGRPIGATCHGVDIDPDAIVQARRSLAPHLPEGSLALQNEAALDGPFASSPGGPLIVIANPPWAARSASRGVATSERLLEDFRRDLHGRRLPERRLGVLSDDYVRFFRMAAEQARHHPSDSLLAFVTNASYLRGAIHRAMRARLAHWFSEIDIVDLGGSALVARKKSAERERDENVFGVRPSVAVMFALRRADHDETAHARVRYVRVFGSVAEKLDALGRPLHFEEVLQPRSQTHFVPTVVEEAYSSWPALSELFPFHREGLQSNRDAFCIDEDDETLRRRLERFVDDPLGFGGKVSETRRHYNPEVAAERAAQALAQSERVIVPLDYRPFERRFAIACAPLCHRPRRELAAALARSSHALVSVRKDNGEVPWAHFGATTQMVDNCFFSSRSGCRTRAFPSHRPDGEPNLERRVALRVLADADGISSGDFLDYALCVLASSTYRERFEPLLRADYARLPPATRPRFEACVRAGRALRLVFTQETAGSGKEVVVGHRRLASTRLAQKIEGCDEAMQWFVP